MRASQTARLAPLPRMLRSTFVAYLLRLLLLALAVRTGTARAEAVCPAAPADLEFEVQSAFEQFAAELFDPAEFQRSVSRARQEVTCLSAAVTPLTAAAYHRLEALDAFLAQDDDRAISSFRAALTADPVYLFPEALVPTGHRLRVLYESARRAPRSEPIDIDTCPARVFWVDGVKVRTLSPDHPSIVQRATRTGRIQWSGLLPAGIGPPSCGGQGVTLGLTVGTAMAGVAAASLWAAALVERQETLRLGEELGAGTTSFAGGEFASCADLLAPGDSAAKRQWADCAGESYTTDYVNPTNNLGYAAEAVTGVVIGLGATAVLLTIRW